jgi:hypothetical protein
MADYDSQLPVRTFGDPQEKIQSKIVDFTTPTQGMVVDTDGLAHVEVHGNNPAGADETLRMSELGSVSVDGLYHATNNSDPSNAGLIAHTRAASPADSDQIKRLTAITNGSVHALDISLFDELGAPYTSSNPLPVTSVDSEGIEVNYPNTSAAVAAGTSVDHDYTVTALMTLKASQFSVSGSGRLKAEYKIETGVATGVFTTKWVKFNSTSNPNIDHDIKENIPVAAGVRVRITIKNTENQPQDLYSTISGHEI